MRYRKKRKKIIYPQRLFGAVSALVLAVVCAVALVSHRTLLEEAGRRMAVLAAAVTMPDQSVELLRDRFQAEIYGDEELPGQQPEGRPLPEPPDDPAQPEEDDAVGETSDSASPPKAARAPKIPSEYAAPLLSESYSGNPNAANMLTYEGGLVRNDTKHSMEEVEEILEEPAKLTFKAGEEIQVLIYHTHATEAFESYDTDRYDTRNTWRSTDNNRNMVAVGDALAGVLESYGIGVIHDSTQHDYPSYNGSYERSAMTISEYLEEYPGIKVVLDIHRDAMQRDDAIIKPVAVIDGKKAAQIMIISGCDDGTMDLPGWRDNLRFAAGFQSYMEQMAPGLTRPVFFCYRKYNQHLSPGALLLEFGSNANTLEEACYSAELAGRALAEYILDHTE